MGNVCSGKKKPRTEKPVVNVYIVDTPRPINGGTQLSRQPSQTRGQQQGDNFQFRNEEGIQQGVDKQEGPSISFIKETNLNKLSFALYGEDLSKVRDTFLNELKRLNDHTMKISKQEFLLMSFENRELLSLLKSKKIDVNSLNLNLTDKNAQNMMNISVHRDFVNKKKFIDKYKEGYPDYLLAKFLKMGSKPSENTNSNKNLKQPKEESKLLDTTFLALEGLEEEENEILIRSSILNEEGIVIEPWSPDVHELFFYSKDPNNNSELDSALRMLASRAKVNFDSNKNPEFNLGNKKMFIKDANFSLANPTFETNVKSHTNGGHVEEGENLPPVMVEYRPKGSELVSKNYESRTFLAMLLCILNYDNMFETNLIRRLIYPQREVLAAPTRSGLHIIKLYINGCRRALILQVLNIYPLLTIHNEQYPHILYEAFKKIYKDVSNACITSLVYRMCNWIPEKMLVSDVGDVFSSYDKLKETLNSGNLLLFWSEINTKVIRPIFGFHTDESTLKRYIKTTSLNPNESDVIELDWEDLYHCNKIEQLFINWNPTIYSHRRTVHFALPTKPKFTGGVDTETFKFQKNGQLLLLIHPHKDVSETRIVIEKHKSMLPIKYKIKYYLFNYNKSRVVIPQGVLREMEIDESKDEILSDIIIFDENSFHENYVIAVDLVPENPADFARIPLDHFEVLSISLYTFVEFDLLEMPFNVVEQTLSISYNCAQAEQLGIDGRKPDDPVASHALFKLTAATSGYYEVRVEGERNMEYTIGIFKFQNYRYAISQNASLKETSESSKAIHSIFTYLDEGSYIVRVKYQKAPEVAQSLTRTRQNNIKGDLHGKSPEKLDSKNNSSKHEIKLHFVAYNQSFTRTLEEQVDKINKPNERGNRMKVEPVALSNSLAQKKVVTGSWNRTVNYGTTKAKVNCYQKFMKNPGFVFTLDDETEVKLKLSVTGNPNPLPYIALSLFEILDDFSFSTLIEDENYEQNTTMVSESVIVKPNTHGYLVLCLCLEPSFNGQFELEIRSQISLKSIMDTRGGIMQMPYQEKMVGELLARSGGHINSSSFLLNSGYLIQFMDFKKSKDAFFTEISTNNIADPISLYLIPTEKARIYDLSDIELTNADFNSAFLYEINSLYRTIEYPSYMLIPSTLQALTKPLNFELKFQSTSKYRITKIPAPVFADSFLFQEGATSDLMIRFRLTSPSKVLFVVQPETPEIHLQMSVANLSLQVQLFECYGMVKDGFMFKALDLAYAGHEHGLQILSNKPTAYVIRIYTTAPNSISFAR